MKSIKLLTGLVIMLSVATMFAHDLFLKPTSFFVKSNKKVSIPILNGTFQTSIAALDAERLTDLSVIDPSGERTNPTSADFTKKDKTAYLSILPEEAGNYVVGFSIDWRENAIKAEEFNKYLVAEGIPQVLEERKRDGELGIDGRYRYAKFVKTIIQADDHQSDSYKSELGYAVELVPLQNPYKLRAGDTIELLCLKDGKPLADQLVTTGHEKNRKHSEGKELQSGSDGIVRFKLTEAGKWYVKFINMVKIDDPKLNYESKWASLTFEIVNR